MSIYIPPNTGGWVEFANNAGHICTLTDTAGNRTFSGLALTLPILYGPPTSLYFDMIINRMENTNAATNGLQEQGNLQVSIDGGSTYHNCLSLPIGIFDIPGTTVLRKAYRLYGDVALNSLITNWSIQNDCIFRITNGRALQNNLVLGEVIFIAKLLNYNGQEIGT